MGPGLHADLMHAERGGRAIAEFNVVLSEGRQKAWSCSARLLEIPVQRIAYLGFF